MTKVKFLKHSGEIFAYFPDIEYNKFLLNNKLKTCYAHIGQHSSCHEDYANESAEATENEYSDLLKELKGQGYNDLEILNKNS